MSVGPSLAWAVLFDLDDTLYAERMFVDGGFRAVAEFLGRLSGQSADGLTERLWALHARDGRGRLFNTLLAELGLPNDQELVLACVQVYRSHPPRLEPGTSVVDTLTALRSSGSATGLVTDGTASVQLRKLLGLPAVKALLDVVVLTDELGPGYAKPSPTPFLVACRLLGVPPAAATYVGNDRRKDFEGARRAGLKTIRVGHPPDEGGENMEPSSVGEGVEADITLSQFEDLVPMLAATERPAILRR